MVNLNLDMRSRHVLQRIAQVIHFCGKQGIALQGRIENSESPSNNLGNFIALIPDQNVYCRDSVLHDHVSKPLLKNATYIHHRSQNEMIEVIDKSIIQQDLINEIKGAKVHTILCVTVCSVCGAKKQREEFIEFFGCGKNNLFEAVVNFYIKMIFTLKICMANVTMVY